MSDVHPTEDIPQAEHGVPPQLIKQLHDGNEQFSRARKQVEKAIDAEVNSLSERKYALREVAEAEKALEKTEAQIAKELGKTE